MRAPSSCRRGGRADRQFARSDRPDEDYQLVLDRVRRRVNERRFALGVQLVVAHRDPLEIAAGYARVAEAAINVLAGAAIAEFERVHGRVPGSELVILGLGRLGGEALTHASDLDLTYLFTGTHEARSRDRSRSAPPIISIGWPPRHGRAQRGDGGRAALRGRHSAAAFGKDGSAISLPSFAEYQQERPGHGSIWRSARARPVYEIGSGARGGFCAIVEATCDAARSGAAGRRRGRRCAPTWPRTKPAQGPRRHQAWRWLPRRSRLRVPHSQLRPSCRAASRSWSARSPSWSSMNWFRRRSRGHRLLTRMLVTLGWLSARSG
jgi:glutamate-ammonia-ligase adenylyltransferase